MDWSRPKPAQKMRLRKKCISESKPPRSRYSGIKLCELRWHYFCLNVQATVVVSPYSADQDLNVEALLRNGTLQDLCGSSEFKKVWAHWMISDRFRSDFLVAGHAIEGRSKVIRVFFLYLWRISTCLLSHLMGFGHRSRYLLFYEAKAWAWIVANAIVVRKLVSFLLELANFGPSRFDS
eukprot:s558_g35.t1